MTKDTAPPPSVARAIDRMVYLLDGQRVDLTGIELDMTGVPTFNRAVYQAVRQIPAGSTITYGGISDRIGMPGSARAVGRVLGHNPFPIVVPCHRVVAAGGRAGGFSATGGVNTKLMMLAAEGADPLQLSARHPCQEDQLSQTSHTG